MGEEAEGTEPPAPHPCPCCGRLVFEEPPGSYGICPICFWEDDAVQLRWPDMAGGANKVSLIQAQINYRETGVSEQRLAKHVRPAHADEPTEAGWRSIDVSDDFEDLMGLGKSGEPWPDDLEALYWWRPTFWRSHNSQI